VVKEYDAQKRYNGLGMEFGDVRDFRCESLVTECMMRLAIKDKHKDMILAPKLKLPRDKDPSQTHYTNRTYGGAKIRLASYRIFLRLSTWKKRIR
jgi:hypothetical protein